MKCIISLGGEPLSKEAFKGIYDKDTFLLGVDGGCAYLDELGLIPQCILGDFDSIEGSLLEDYRRRQVPIYEFPERKDFTDSELALQFAREKGFDEVLLIGTGGGEEVDHFLGNLFLLLDYPEACVVLEHETIWSGREGYYTIDREDGPYFSILPMETTQVAIKGFSYDGTFNTAPGKTLTLRNKLLEAKGEIEVLTGKVLFIQRKQ